ncbi:MAG TPA: MAPEG family protein [Candidatus Binataceae bacterium]
MRAEYHFYAFITVVLFLKMAANSAVQGRARLNSNTFVIPEDARFFAGTEPAKEEVPLVRRAAAVWRNDLENIPIFLFLALVYVSLGCWATGAFVYFSIFALARIVHTVLYFRALQPWRTISFAIGLAVCFALSVHILIAVFSDQPISILAIQGAPVY